MSVIFNGKTFAEEIISGLPHGKGGLVVIFDPENSASQKYVSVKEKVAQRLGVGFKKYSENISVELIEQLNREAGINGIVVQLPIVQSQQLIDAITPEKDVDGLQETSRYVPATVRAVVEILKIAVGGKDINKLNIVIVGDEGEVGKRLKTVLKMLNSQVTGMDKGNFDAILLQKADVIISATGSKHLIKSEMVRDGVVAIDVGYPDGDFEPRLVEKAAFFTPVPGGVGPVTVAMLFANLLENI